MIILGKRHFFSDMELSILKEQFDSIDFVGYNNVEPQQVIEQIEKLISDQNKSIILLNTKAPIPDALLSHLTNLESKNIRYLTTETFLEHYLHKCYIPEDHTSAAFLEEIRPYSKWQYLLKRAFDIISVIVLGAISSPFMIYAAYRIKKESPNGPILFKQDRVGRNNEEFTCIKFRSMIPDAEADGAKFASENDPRIFKWGETMRKTRIDELPQLWNVLKGEMHLVGPRPERKFWINQFKKEIPYYNQRHIVAPGITGWAQVNYPYGANAEDARQKLMYDLYYIKHWSPWLEIQTMLKTIIVVIGKKGI